MPDRPDIDDFYRAVGRVSSDCEWLLEQMRLVLYAAILERRFRDERLAKRVALVSHRLLNRSQQTMFDALKDVADTHPEPVRSELRSLVGEVKTLLERRNAAIHSYHEVAFDDDGELAVQVSRKGFHYSEVDSVVRGSNMFAPDSWRCFSTFMMRSSP